MKSSLTRPLIVLIICAVCTFPVLLLWSRGFVPLQQLEFFAEDWQARLGRKAVVDDRLVLVGIDKPVYAADFNEEELQTEPVLREMQHDFPWSRAVWARVIDKLADAGAKVIVIDLVFASEGEGDDLLKQALERHRDRVVLGYNINIGQTERGEFSELLLPNETLLPATESPSPVTDERLGYVNIWPDFDDTLRRVAFRKSRAQAGYTVPEGVVLESLAARALRKFGQPAAIPDGSDSIIFRYTAPAGVAFVPRPVGEILSPKLWDSNCDGGRLFKDKIVLIGPTAAIFHDEHSTPFTNPRQMGGPEIHLQFINAALRGEFLREPSPGVALTLIGCAGLLAAAFCFLIRPPGKRLLGVAAVAVGCAVLTHLLYDHGGLVLPLAVPLLVMVLCSLLVFAYDFVLERLERMKLRNTMGLYFSPRVLEAVLADPGSMEPRRADVTMLLTDLRNSTPLAELLGPQGMFALLNRVFEAQTAAIMREEGNLEHFLGDQFLSYWGAPQPQADAPDRAWRAALKLIASMEAIRPTLSAEVQNLFGYGVALHGGGVLVGNKGSAQHLDYGLVGDAVNEAARIEALTKYYGAALLVSGSTFARLTSPGSHRLVDSVIVKGKSEPVALYECANPCVPPEFAIICQRYAVAYAAYSAGQFESAQAQFELLIREFSDGPSKTLAVRCAALQEQPPEAWDGIWRMAAK